MAKKRESTAMSVVVPLGNASAAAAIQPERIGVLLVNLGTPDACDARSVRVYLKEFLSDRRVIEDQGLVWQAILNGIILRVRPARKALDYKKIWNVEKNESPLKTITRSQAEEIAKSKMPDLTAASVEQAIRTVEGTARSLGLEVV